MSNSNLKVCDRCVMDTSVSDIFFYQDGRCSLCKNYDEVFSREIYSNKAGQEKLKNFISRIKKENKNKKYDCLIGLSGGVDSSYVAHLVKENGLNPLAIHLDNGWNSELATFNIEKLVKKLGIDLHTEILDWNEFRDIQRSFMKSSISNIEIPTDHAIWATLIKTASKFNIKYIFSGNNVVTESIMPDSWLYGSKDFKLIKSIHRKYGELPLKSFPHLSLFDYFYYLLFKGIKWIPILNYVPFVKSDAKKMLIDTYDWRDYGGKHYESIFTRFFHAYYLPKKFNYDLRKSYLSSLVCSKQISREKALRELELPPASQSVINKDISYVSKKLGFSEKEFKNLMEGKNKVYSDYGNNNFLWERLSNFVSWARSKITNIS